MIEVGLALLKWAAILWLGTVIGFLAAVKAKEIYYAGRANLFWKVHLWPFAIAFLVADALFNFVFGTIIFRERPRELLFSSRVQRHYRHGTGWRLRKAAVWARRLNAVEPGHIRV